MEHCNVWYERPRKKFPHGKERSIGRGELQSELNETSHCSDGSDNTQWDKDASGRIRPVGAFDCVRRASNLS